ncbi:MAG: hypothetical protein ACOC84_04315 [Actinomycetota bacterium]
MGVEGELPSRSAATDTAGEQSIRFTRGDRDAHRTGLERALDEVRRVGVEAGELLRTEGVKPSTLVYAPPGARSYPLVGRAFSRVTCGEGWHVVPGVVMGTDGRLWARTPVPNSTPQKDLDAWKLQVEPPAGPLQLPPAVTCDGVSLHTVRWVADEAYVKADLIDRLLDGYARLLFLHQRRRS